MVTLSRATAGPWDMGSQTWRAEEGVEGKAFSQWVQVFSCKRDEKSFKGA